VIELRETATEIRRLRPEDAALFMGCFWTRSRPTPHFTNPISSCHRICYAADDDNRGRQAKPAEPPSCRTAIPARSVAHGKPTQVTPN
jgi:hypothetical protein